MKTPSLLSFHSRFPSEDACVSYLEAARWKGKPACPRCGCVKTYRIATRKNYKCAGCRRNFTVRHGTIFEDSKLPLRTWFLAIWLVTTSRPGVSSVELAEKLSVTQKTAWFVLQRIQYAVSHESFQKPLSGDVEMDDTEMSRTREGKKARVIGIVERKGEVRMQAVESVDRKTAHDIVERHVAKGSTVMTDEFQSFTKLGKAGYDHRTVNHGREYAKPDGTHTNTVEGLFGNFQRRLRGIHVAVSAKHLGKYCGMYGQRYNTRQLEPLGRFDAWFSRAAGRISYRALVG